MPKRTKNPTPKTPGARLREFASKVTVPPTSLLATAHVPGLRPMTEAPTTGPIVEILAATTNRAGCKGWLIVHYADGGGEEQPRFRGWFYWTGYGFDEVPEASLIGWLPLPDLNTYTMPRKPAPRIKRTSPTGAIVPGTDPCTCGHTPEEHGREPAYPGSTACRAEDYDGPCACVAYEDDPEEP